MRKILILGGTGAMGTHLVSLFENTDNEVWVTSRSKRADKHNVKYFQGNAHDVNFLKKVLNQPVDIIVDFMIYTTLEFKNRVNFLLASCKQYVYLSSARVYSNENEIITEETPRLLDVCKDKVYLETDEYALTKARQEDVLKINDKKNWTIIRPYVTYSETRLQLGVMEKEDWLYRALHGRSIVFSKDIASKVTTLTYGFDVARGIAAIIGKTDALGEIFHITAKSKSWKEILAIYLSVIEKKTGSKPKVFFLDKNERLSYRKPNISIWQVLVDRLYNRRFDNSKIANYIDIDTFLQVEEGLMKSLEYFIDHPNFKFINWRSEAYYDMLTHEHASLSEMETFKQKIKYIIYRYFVPIKFF
ncbi:NAD-dependent epimerase/dehydratase family protein [Segatella copri]|uniref:NAD-dependent epimerase/dehydratase family protein n=1 Tax=Segatella copri TaxID=165179 RepID=UPI00294AEAE9|nr:NAD-dependent epimerase/dehydratase family protein [Segatella copri]WOG02683.1 NAD-dependent epimerase/dehydratase family protein [Segatella copri]